MSRTKVEVKVSRGTKRHQSKTLQIIVTPGLHTFLHNYAATKGISVSALLSPIVERFAANTGCVMTHTGEICVMTHTGEIVDA